MTLIEAVELVLADVGCRCVKNHLALLQADDAVKAVNEVWPMQANHCAAGKGVGWVARALPQKCVEQFIHQGRIQAGEWFIGKHQLGLLPEQPSQGDPLPLPP